MTTGSYRDRPSEIENISWLYHDGSSASPVTFDLHDDSIETLLCPSWRWIQKIIPGIKSKYFCCAHHHDKTGPWIDLEAFLKTVKFAEWQLFHLVISSKCFPAICIPLTQTYLWHSMNKKQSAWVCWHVPIKLQSGPFCPKSKHLTAKIDQLETSDLLKIKMMIL